MVLFSADQNGGMDKLGVWCGGYNELETILLSRRVQGASYTLLGWGEGMTIMESG
jgi:hypothetical protein